MRHSLHFIKKLASCSVAFPTSSLLLRSANAAVSNLAPLVLPINVSSPALTLSSPDNSASAPFTYEILSANASVLSSNLQADANTNPVCNGSKFGKILNRDSCTEAWRLITVDTYPLRLGQKGFGPYDVQLPHRQSSCKCCQSYCLNLGVQDYIMCLTRARSRWNLRHRCIP